MHITNSSTREEGLNQRVSYQVDRISIWGALLLASKGIQLDEILGVEGDKESAEFNCLTPYNPSSEDDLMKSEMVRFTVEQAMSPVIEQCSMACKRFHLAGLSTKDARYALPVVALITVKVTTTSEHINALLSFHEEGQSLPWEVVQILQMMREHIEREVLP